MKAEKVNSKVTEVHNINDNLSVYLSRVNGITIVGMHHFLKGYVFIKLDTFNKMSLKIKDLLKELDKIV